MMNRLDKQDVSRCRGGAAEERSVYLVLAAAVCGGVPI